MVKFVTNASSATWWPKLEPMLSTLHVGQIRNHVWWHHLVVKFWTNTSGTTYNWPNLEPKQVAFYLAGEITQVIDSIPWVRCASGNVSLKLNAGALWEEAHIFIAFIHHYSNLLMPSLSTDSNPSPRIRLSVRDQNTLAIHRLTHYSKGESNKKCISTAKMKLSYPCHHISYHLPYHISVMMK